MDVNGMLHAAAYLATGWILGVGILIAWPTVRNLIHKFRDDHNE